MLRIRVRAGVRARLRGWPLFENVLFESPPHFSTWNPGGSMKKLP